MTKEHNYMNSKEVKRFHNKNKGKYYISKNKDLLFYLHTKGYCKPNIIKELQETIDTITYWYIRKYPDYKISSNLINQEHILDDISKEMSIKKLINALPSKWLLECNYYAKGEGTKLIYNDTKNKIIDYKRILFIHINRTHIKSKHQVPYFLLRAYSDSGKVIYDTNIKEYTNNKDITLDELLTLFKEKYIRDLEFNELKECINNHNNDIELRNRILKLVALELLYSNHTTPEIGYERAKYFINEFNEEMNLSLDTKEIDTIIKNSYIEEKTPVIKKLLKTPSIKQK